MCIFLIFDCDEYISCVTLIKWSIVITILKLLTVKYLQTICPIETNGEYKVKQNIGK